MQAALLSAAAHLTPSCYLMCIGMAACSCWCRGRRRNGKPTSLGCFDLEQEAARAYDKMMLWCELHQSSGMKGGITNFDPTEYERDLAYLQSVSQVTPAAHPTAPGLAQEQACQALPLTWRQMLT